MDFDIKEEVYKCSKCGLCQSVCPIYIATKNEMFLPRGRCIVLNNFFNNGKKLSKEFIKNLDICLNCNLCKEFCPSNIDIEKIVLNLKNKYSKKKFSFSLFIRFLFFIKGFFTYKPLYKLRNTGTKGNIVYFQGCYNRFVDSSDKNASLELIEELGYKVVKILSNCCGYPILSDGNLSQFEKNAKKIISKLDFEYDYVLCSCDSCFSTLSKIQNNEFNSKLITLDKFLELNKYPIPESPDIYFYKPLLRKNKVYLSSRIPNINLKGTCSLLENFFFYKHKKLAKIISKIICEKNNFKDKTLVTTCNLTKLGLSSIFKSKVFVYSEYLKKEVD